MLYSGNWGHYTESIGGDSVCIRYVREGIFGQLEGQEGGWTYNGFQFPTNGNVSSDNCQEVIKIRSSIWFQFPTNGNVSSDSPYFRPRRAVGSYTPKPNTNCTGLFSIEHSPRKPHKP
ncbi:hypothetical protein F4X88_02260 [Candidatus Poribacteria bacterium]|nr:hypothetical protein [Candidatus Poribacteria bacterium]MYA55094.1 hypothetical protein [Candidatus Poribacteria bacterium]